MKKKELKDLREKEIKDLVKKVEEKKLVLKKGEKNLKKARLLRKDIAQMKTIIKEKEIDKKEQ